MKNRKLKLKGVLEGQHEHFFYSESGNSISPNDETWKIPVNTTLDIPVIDADKIVHAMTMVYEDDHGRIMRKVEFFVDRSTGNLYTDPADQDRRSLSDSILYEAQFLIGCCDSPKALKGYPWNCKSNKEAASRIAENVRNLLPSIVRDFAVTSSGRGLKATPGPYWYASSWREGELVLLTDQEQKTTQDYARAFDYDDRAGLESFIRLLDSMNDNDSSKQIDATHSYVIEHRPGSDPRGNFAKFVKSLSADLTRYLIDTPIPDDIRTKISALSTVSATPDRQEAEGIYLSLSDIETSLDDMDIQTERDYARNISLLQIATIRAGHRAGYKFQPKTPQQYPTP